MNFWNKVAIKRILPFKNRRSKHYHWILHIWVRLVPNFSLNWQFFGLNFPKRIFLVENRKSEHRHSVLRIQISLGTKFQFKLTILIFLTKPVQKGYFQSKMEKLNTTTEFCIFKLVIVPDFSLIWQFWYFGPNLPSEGNTGPKLKNHIFVWVHGHHLLY